MWKSKKKKLALGDLTPRIRGFILDSQIQNGHEISLIVGCSVISDEVAQMEEEQSDNRVERIEYLIPLLYAYARTLSEGAVEYQRQTLPEELDSLPPEIWSESRRMVEQLAFASLVGAISQLVDMNLLYLAKRKK